MDMNTFFNDLQGKIHQAIENSPAKDIEKNVKSMMTQGFARLDLATREALAMALNEFEGTVMLVSHDRALLRSVCDEFWMVSRGGVEPFDGDLDDYQRYLLDESKRLREELKAAPAPKVQAAAPAPAPASADQRKQDAQRRQEQSERLRPLRKQIDKLDRSMAALAEEKAALEQQLTRPLPPAEMADAGRKLKQVGDLLAAQEEEWISLSEQLETS